MLSKEVKRKIKLLTNLVAEDIACYGEPWTEEQRRHFADGLALGMYDKSHTEEDLDNTIKHAETRKTLREKI